MPPIPLSIIAVHPTGFEVTFTLQGLSLADLDTALRDLVALGWRPVTGGDTWPRTPTGDPLCPRHRVVMRQREKQGDTWYSHPVVHPQTGEELWCRGYDAGPSSPGWGVPGPA
jgi:hypothetical protein